MEDKISQEKMKSYFKITETALAKVKSKIISGEEKEAEEIIQMVENYVSDAKHFEKQGELVNAFAALNYAHGWLDAGVRLNIFDVKDNKLFTIR